jgi:hypothetical protein
MKYVDDCSRISPKMGCLSPYEIALGQHGSLSNHGHNLIYSVCAGWTHGPRSVCHLEYGNYQVDPLSEDARSALHSDDGVSATVTRAMSTAPLWNSDVGALPPLRLPEAIGPSNVETLVGAGPASTAPTIPAVIVMSVDPASAARVSPCNAEF